MCAKELLCFLVPMTAPSTLAWPKSHHLLMCFLYYNKCITPQSEYCAVFSPLLEGVVAFFGGTRFLLMCSNKRLCFLAHKTPPSTLALPKSHHLLMCFLYSYKKCSSQKSEYCAVFSPLLEGVDASLLAQGPFSCVPTNYFVSLHPCHHLPHSPGLSLIIC